MENEKVFAMPLSKVYPMLIAKAVRKGRTEEEVYAVTCWLTGYTEEQIRNCLAQNIPYGTFFEQAPAYHPNSEKITGVICGIRIENIEDPLMKRIRQLDKLVDELAKGRKMEKILRQ